MLRRLLFLIAVIVVAWVIFLPAYSKLEDIKRRNIELENRIADLTIDNKNLREEQRMLKSNPEYLEKVARDRMGLIKDGESIMRITPEQIKE